MARTTGDTMAEGLKKVVALIAQLSILPDADVQFLTELQMMISGYLRNAPADAGGNQNLMAPQGPPPGPPNPGMGPALGLGAGPMPGLGPGGPGMPPMDELARALGSPDRAQ